MSPERYLPETVGPGAAFLDYDGDGWMDVYLVNSGPCDFYRPRAPLGNALYRNDGNGRFTDVTEEAGVAGAFFGMGVAVGDYDNDGFPDLYVTSYGRTTLFHNSGDGTFTDVTESSGLAIDGWTTSAAWFDYDGDGHLDLFVCSYVRHGLDSRASCGASKHGRRYYCVPRIFEPTPSRLYRNEGDGTFSPAGIGTAIAAAPGKALGVVAADFDDDGRMDLFVANDTVQNYLFANRGGGRWEERGLAAGVALSEHGRARSGMGVDAADYDGDGRLDLFVANIDHELFSLYRNQGDGSFVDEARANGIASATRLVSGWGVRFFDADNDGRVDLFLANGHPDDMIDGSGTGVRYAEPPLLFHNEGGRYRDASREAGTVFAKPLTARGLAAGDYDNDGLTDLLVANNGAPPILIRNESSGAGGWIGVKLVGTASNRDAVGARVAWSAGGVVRHRAVTGGGSYLSSHDPRLVLGLGSAHQLDWLEVEWPGPGRRIERFSDLEVGRYVSLVEGEGYPAPSPRGDRPE
jgi:hypothetical protein